jgi:hypothetical protein
MNRYRMIEAIKDTVRIERYKGKPEIRINAAEQLLASPRTIQFFW